MANQGFKQTAAGFLNPGFGFIYVIQNAHALLANPTACRLMENANKELILASNQLASVGEKGGEFPMAEHYFDKFLEQNFASIDDEFSAIKEEKNLLREDFKSLANNVQNSINQALAEMREKDNQRQAENLAINAKIDSNIESIKKDNDSLNKWLIAFLIGTFLSIVSIAISVWLR